MNNRKTPAVKANNPLVGQTGALKVLSKVDVNSTEANNLLTTPMEVDSILPPEELSAGTKQSQDYNEVAEYKHLFDTFG